MILSNCIEPKIRFKVIPVLIFLSLTMSFSQNKAPEMTDEFKLKYGQRILENTRRALMKSNDTTYADFWNLALAYCLLTDDKNKVESLLLKSKERNSANFGNLIEDSSSYYGGIEKTPFHQMLGDRFTTIIDKSELNNNVSQVTPITGLISSDNKKVNIGLIETLKTLYSNDQRYRHMKDFHKDSSLMEKQRVLDGSNGIALQNIFSKYGYPGISSVGRSYSSYAAIILAHTNSLELFKELFPFVFDAYKKNDLGENIFLLLVDKLHWRMDGKQIFGTQAGIPFYSDKDIVKYKNKYLLE